MAEQNIKPLIAPSVLNADFSRLAEIANDITGKGADWLHMDVMDGHFVPNITIGAPVIASLRKHTKTFLDCHIMVAEPEKWVSDFAKAGADSYTFHLEATKDPKALIEQIKKSGMKAAIAIKPKTPVEDVIPFLDEVHMVLVMTVEPGFGGQKFMEDMMPKVRKLRELKPNLNIQVDGGVSPDTIKKCAEAGANVIVSGSAIFNYPERYEEIINELRSAVQKSIEERQNKN